MFNATRSEPGRGSAPSLGGGTGNYAYGGPGRKETVFEEMARSDYERFADRDKLKRQNSLRLMDEMLEEDQESPLLGDGTMGRRMLRVERQLQKLTVSGASDLQSTSTTPSDPEKSGEPPRQKFHIQRIPSERWRLFKNSNKIQPELSAILVATRVQKKTLGKQANESGSAETPFKIALNSQELINYLSKITGEFISAEQNVLVRPFKYLVYHREDIICGAKDAENEYQMAVKNLQESTCSKAKGDREEEVRDAEKLYNEMTTLVKFMEEDMKDIFEMRAAISSQSLTHTEFENLWHIYQPGGWVLHQDDLQEPRSQAYRIIHVTGGQEIIDTRRRSHFEPHMDRDFDSSSEWESRAKEEIKPFSKLSALVLDCVYIDCDGMRYGAKAARFVIPSYAGKRAVRALPVVPAEYYEGFEELRRKLVERGRRFMKLATGRHVRYKGATLRMKKESYRYYYNYHVAPEEIDSEVMVDQPFGVTQFSKILEYRNWNIRLGGTVVKAPTSTDVRETFDPLPFKEGDKWVTDTFDDSALERSRRGDFMSTSDLFDLCSLNSQPSDDFVALLPPRIFGYALLNRKCYALNLETIQDIDPEKRKAESSYDNLVLPENHKNLLQAMIKNKIGEYQSEAPEKSVEQYSVDVVKGKGKGIIILLHGVPGVGKTSTAECIAAQLNRPLLPITCGDLGMNPGDTASALETYCDLAYRWRCVLLLDEADVFLAKREKGDITRNALVSVFLRTLEYYSGVLILTTNRVGEFDEAFRSRIHMSLYYPKLDVASTHRIWENNIERLKKSELDIDIEEDRIRDFASWFWKKTEQQPSHRWNGRQIKNAFQTALALADWDFHENEGGKHSNPSKRPLLRAAHFARIAETSADFDDYITEVHGVHDEDPYAVIAEREYLRKDDYVLKRNVQARERKVYRARESPRRSERGERWETRERERLEPSRKRETRRVKDRYGYESEVPDEESEEEDSEVREARGSREKSKRRTKKGSYSGDEFGAW